MALAAAASLLVSSCGKDPDGTEYAVVTGDATSCIMGTVTNAFTGGRVDISTASIWAVFNGSILQGNMLNGGDTLKSNVTGDYYICGVPNATKYNAGFTLPVHFKVDGYQERIYNVTPSDDTPDRNTNTAEPGFWATPTVVQHAEIYKLSDLVAKDFTVTVTAKGSALADASVWLKPTDTALAVAGLTGTTGANGAATFAASSLAFGATYTMTVVPKAPVAADGSYIPAKFTGTIVIGTPATSVTGATFKVANPFSISVDMTAASLAPVLLSQTPASTVSTGGTVTLVWDRAVTYDTASALNGAGVTAAIASYGTKTDGTACVAADVGTPVLDTAATSTSINLAISGATVTLTPKWTTAPSSTSTCGGMTLTYTIAGLDFYAKDATIPTSASPANVTIYLTAPHQTN